MNCVAQESWSLLNIFKGTLGLEKVPRPRTLYQYRADPGITATLQRLQRTAAWDLWVKERIAAMDPTGSPPVRGRTWRADRAGPKKYREYDKAHYMAGVQTLVTPYTKVTRGT